MKYLILGLILVLLLSGCTTGSGTTIFNSDLSNPLTQESENMGNPAISEEGLKVVKTCEEACIEGKACCAGSLN